MIGRGARWWQLGVALALVGMAACRKDRSKASTEGETAVDPKAQWVLDSLRRDAEIAAAAAPSELAGSTWRLVRLQSSDDKVLTPESRAVYTVEFGPDGKVAVVGGCNRGTGTWTTTPPSGLTFGPLATTRAMCPAGSMSARFLGDFQYMRSYQLVGGRLYISLMADGGIYEFVPEEAPPVPVSPGATAVPVVFVCSDSTGARSRITATFASGSPGKVTLTRGRKTVVASQVEVASGAKYEGPGVMLWNKGRDAMVTWRGANLNCALTIE